MKKCNKCKETKALSLFSKDSNKKDGMRTICKECSSAQRAKTYAIATSSKRKVYLAPNILGFSKYHISSDGVVTNRRTGNNIVPHIRNEYIYVGLFDDSGKCYKKNIHRLIAEAYVSNDYNKPCVNHIDGNKTNNNVSNLEWVTHQENTIHAYNNNLVCHAKGTSHHWSGKPSINSRKIICTTKDGNEIIFNNSLEPVDKGYATQQTKVNACCNNRRKSHNGNKWRFL